MLALILAAVVSSPLSPGHLTLALRPGPELLPPPRLLAEVLDLPAPPPDLSGVVVARRVMALAVMGVGTMAFVVGAVVTSQGLTCDETMEDDCAVATDMRTVGITFAVAGTLLGALGFGIWPWE